MDFDGLFSEIEQEIYRCGKGGLTETDHWAVAAATALQRRPDLIDFDPALCLKWFIEHRALPLQTWENDFGQPSITVVRNEDFRVDVLYWIQNASPSHRHISCGSFAALSGRRLHVVYQYEEKRSLGENLTLGALERTTVELMRDGDVRAIRPDFIHDLYWIDKPSITLSVRCSRHASPGQPLEYWGPGFSYLDAVHHEDSSISKRVAGLQLMRRSSVDLYLQTLTEVLRTASPIVVFHAINDAVSWSPSRLRELLITVGKERKDGLLEELLPVIGVMHRRKTFEQLYTPDERAQMLAGLLWSGIGHEQLLDFLRKEFPDEDPRGVLRQGSEELIRRSRDAEGYVRPVLSAVEG